jgi:poly(A) polymerase
MIAHLETDSHNSEPIQAIPHEPRTYARSQHPISRKQISDGALKVLYRLNKAGFRACLVGGGVRDLLLGYEPKDFDVATDARPEQVRELFRNCRLIGRRFRLAHVRFGREIVEVATFRAPHEEHHEDALMSQHGRILRDNVYGDIEDDVWRRDFSINALYYDINDFSLIDYVGGFEDVQARRLRLIGDPERRYREDPVRMLRAIRFASKLGLSIDPIASAPFSELGHLLDEIAPSRLFDETLKLFHGGAAQQSYEMLRRYGLFCRLFPSMNKVLDDTDSSFPHLLASHALGNTDQRVVEGRPVTPAFLFAALLWCPMEMARLEATGDGVTASEAQAFAADSVISAQLSHVAIPRRFTSVMREIWALQPRLEKRSRKRIAKLVQHRRFRAAYDFLVLRGQAGEPVGALGDWWTRYQDAADEERFSMIKGLKAKGGGKNDRRGRRSARGR